MRRMVIAFVFALAISRAQAQPPSPPAQASEAGFSNLVFDEEFQGRWISASATLVTNGMPACGGTRFHRRALSIFLTAFLRSPAA